MRHDLCSECRIWLAPCQTDQNASISFTKLVCEPSGQLGFVHPLAGAVPMKADAVPCETGLIVKSGNLDKEAMSQNGTFVSFREPK
jgi:hypothetical protein